MATLNVAVGGGWAAAAARDATVRSLVAESVPMDLPCAARWRHSTAARAVQSAFWPASVGRDAPARAAWPAIQGSPCRTLAAVRWPLALERDRAARVAWRGLIHAPSVMALEMPWRRSVPADRPQRVVWRGLMRHLAAGARSLWRVAVPVDAGAWVRWGVGVRRLPAGWMVVSPLVPAEAGAVVAVKGVYMVLNSVSLVTYPGGVEVPALSFAMSLDADSWTWSWSATVHRSAEALLGQAGDAPAVVTAVVNGASFRLLVERVARAAEFPTRRLSVGGRGLAANLAAPQAVERAYSVASTMTAQQLAADVLSVNGVPLGWAVDWGIEDWLVPASAWSFQGAPIDAVVDIASAAGAIVQPHPTDQVLRVRPRYPHLPWAWAGVSPDFDLPASLIQVEGVEWVRKPAYNRVFVGGVGLGVFGPVTRDGTAGDLIARQINHPLITSPVAHRQRGAAALADTGRQVHLTLSLPVIQPLGVIMPGSVVRYSADATRIGLVRSVSVSWATPVVRQTIGVECHAE